MKRLHFLMALLVLAFAAGTSVAQNTYAGGVRGSVTANCVPKSSGSGAISTTVICSDGTSTTIGTNKVIVTEASGNTTIAGTLATTGASTFSSTALVTGNATVQGALNFAADAGSNDTYVITLAPAPAAYTTGMYIAFTAATANTGACSINVNGLGAKALKRGVSTDPGDNFIKAGSVVLAIYDGTNFQMIQPAAQ
jgi:hypothetical protein